MTLRTRLHLLALVGRLRAFLRGYLNPHPVPRCAEWSKYTHDGWGLR